MLKSAVELGPLAYVLFGIAVIALACFTRNAREIWFVLVVAGAVAMAIAGYRGKRRVLVVEIGGMGRLTFRSKQRL